MPLIKSVAPAVGVALGLSVIAVTCVFGDGAVEVLPKTPGKARYEGLQAHCPFSLASAPVATPVPQASFAANWFVTGIGRIGGKDFVSIKSRDLATQFSLFEGESRRAEEVALVSVTWSDAVGKSTVILRKGTETAKLEFNEQEVHASPKAPVGPLAANIAAHPMPPGAGGPNRSIPVPAVAGAPQIPQAMAPVPVSHRRVAPIRPPQ